MKIILTNSESRNSIYPIQFTIKQNTQILYSICLKSETSFDFYLEDNKDYYLEIEQKEVNSKEVITLWKILLMLVLFPIVILLMILSVAYSDNKLPNFISWNHFSSRLKIYLHCDKQDIIKITYDPDIENSLFGHYFVSIQDIDHERKLYSYQHFPMCSVKDIRKGILRLWYNSLPIILPAMTVLLILLILGYDKFFVLVTCIIFLFFISTIYLYWISINYKQYRMLKNNLSFSCSQIETLIRKISK